MTTALIGYECNASPPESYRDLLVDQARDDVIATVLEDATCNCGGYVLDKSDFELFVAERVNGAEMLRQLVTGAISPDAFKAHVIKALDAYGGHYATDRADYLEAQ